MESNALTIPPSVLWTKPFKLNYFARRGMVTECGHSSKQQNLAVSVTFT